MSEFSPSPSKRTVLTVDDSPANNLLIRDLIARRNDLGLIVATTGNEGFGFACSNQPDVILLDIKLPDIDGNDLMEMLRAHPLTAHIPIIALSSNAHPKQIEQGLKAGFFSYVTKPFRITELMATIDAALQFSAVSQSVT